MSTEIVLLLLTAVAIFSCFVWIWRENKQSLRAARGRWHLAETVARELRGSMKADLAEELVYLARAESGFERQSVRLRELLHTSLEGREIQLHQGGDPYVAADADALGHVLKRLVAKATQVQLVTEGRWAEFVILGEGLEEPRLAVARRIVVGHGGDLRASEGRTTVRLPLLS